MLPIPGRAKEWPGLEWRAVRDLIKQRASEARDALGRRRARRVVYTDAKETGRVVLAANDLPLKLEPRGGGGTMFGPVLGSLDADGERPAAPR